MLLSSLTVLFTFHLSLLTVAFATSDRRADVLHDKGFKSTNLHVESALGASGRHASSDWQDELGSPPYYLTDKWQGQNFFNGWTFFTNSDPTHGSVNYIARGAASAKKLAYVDNNGVAVMKVDSSKNLPLGAKRDSVRIFTNKSWNGGLFVLDALKFPYGCAVWPAWWMVGPDWPNGGEIDIFEGVNLNTANQYTAHTAAGCRIATSPSPVFSVPASSAKRGATSCGPTPNNNGCYFIDSRNGSYGKGLNANGGAVLAMEWEKEGIRIWNFPRGKIPSDLSSGQPRPELWSKTFLKAAWETKTCPINTYFKKMRMVFNITLCGDWAGNAYAKSGCPGSCAARVEKGSNFNNAAWAINYAAVYTRGSSSAPTSAQRPFQALE